MKSLLFSVFIFFPNLGFADQNEGIFPDKEVFTAQEISPTYETAPNVFSKEFGKFPEEVHKYRFSFLDAGYLGGLNMADNLTEPGWITVLYEYGEVYDLPSGDLLYVRSLCKKKDYIEYTCKSSKKYKVSIIKSFKRFGEEQYSYKDREFVRRVSILDEVVIYEELFPFEGVKTFGKHSLYSIAFLVNKSYGVPDLAIFLPTSKNSVILNKYNLNGQLLSSTGGERFSSFIKNNQILEGCFGKGGIFELAQPNPDFENLIELSLLMPEREWPYPYSEKLREVSQFMTFTTERLNYTIYKSKDGKTIERPDSHGINQAHYFMLKNRPGSGYACTLEEVSVKVDFLNNEYMIDKIGKIW